MAIGNGYVGIGNERVIDPKPDVEYMSGGQEWPLRGGYGSLASRVLEVTERGGPALAEVMCAEPAVIGPIRTIRQGILAQGVQITATVQIDPEDDPEDLSDEEIRTAFLVEDHCERSWRNCSTPGLEVLDRLLGAMEYRTMLGEKVYRVPDSGPDAGLYVLDRIPVKDPGTWAFVRDRHGNTRGIRVNVVNDGGHVESRILDRSKFLILPWLPRKSNPWGEGVVQAIYNAWNMMVQVPGLEWEYVKQFAVPKTWAKPPDPATAGGKPRPIIGEDGQPTGPPVSPTTALFNELKKFRASGSLMVMPYGSEIGVLEPTEDGDLFDRLYDRLERKIVLGIHQTTRMALGEKRSNGSDPATSQDLLALVITAGKCQLQQMLQRQHWYYQVAWNFGQDIADRFTPSVSFGMTSPEDFSRNANAVYRLYVSGVIAPEERREALRFLGLPFGRRLKKSEPAPQVSPTPTRGARALNVRRRAS